MVKKTNKFLYFLQVGAFSILLASCDNTENTTSTSSSAPYELTNATVYGTLELSENIDASRSGMTMHDLRINVDFIDADSAVSSFSEKKLEKKSYKPLSWALLKKNILDDADNYQGYDAIPGAFKDMYFNAHVKILGRIYKHCMDTYYLNPTEESKPKEALSCWSATEQHHIRLAGYHDGN